MTTPKTSLEFTGERCTPRAPPEVANEHWHRYLFSLQLCGGKDILDVASGAGYGSALLATVARRVVGVDISREAVQHATVNYASRNLAFLQGTGTHLPLGDGSFDVVVSFETVEHVSEQEQFLVEIKRLLRPGGLLVMSSPDRDVYSAQGTEPNPYHVKELDKAEFRTLLRKYFRHAAVLGQSTVLGSVILPVSESGQGQRRFAQLQSFRRLDEHAFEAALGLERAVYVIVVASDAPPPAVMPGILDDPSHRLGLYAELERRNEEILRRDVQLGQLAHQARTREARIGGLARELRSREDEIAALRSSTSWKISAPVRLLECVLRRARRWITGRE